MKTPKDGLKRPAKLDKFDYQDEREILLLRVRSFHSGRAYRMALERLEAWCAGRALSLSRSQRRPRMIGSNPRKEKTPRQLYGSACRARAPFGELSASVIADRLRLVTEKMLAEGNLQSAHSAHGLRHAFAVRREAQIWHEDRPPWRLLFHLALSIPDHL